MKIFGLEIKRAEKPVTVEITQPTLIVTGQCQDKELTQLEEHCKSKGQIVIATKLPVLGVFKMSDGSVLDGTKS